MSTASTPASTAPSRPFPIAVLVALAAALAIALMPTPDGLTIAF